MIVVPMIYSSFAGQVKEDLTDIEFQYWKHRFQKAHQDGKRILVFASPEDMPTDVLIYEIEEYLQTEIEHHIMTERKATDSTNQPSSGK